MIRPPICPICKKTLTPSAGQENASLPFCSERCRKIDLFRWFDGGYQIVEPLDPDLLDLDDESLPDME